MAHMAAYTCGSDTFMNNIAGHNQEEACIGFQSFKAYNKLTVNDCMELVEWLDGTTKCTQKALNTMLRKLHRWLVRYHYMSSLTNISYRTVCMCTSVVIQVQVECSH